MSHQHLRRWAQRLATRLCCYLTCCLPMIVFKSCNVLCLLLDLILCCVLQQHQQKRDRLICWQQAVTITAFLAWCVLCCVLCVVGWCMYDEWKCDACLPKSSCMWCETNMGQQVVSNITNCYFDSHCLASSGSISLLEGAPPHSMIKLIHAPQLVYTMFGQGWSESQLLLPWTTNQQCICMCTYVHI